MEGKQDILEKPVALTIFRLSDYIYHTLLNNRLFPPVMDGQFTPAGKGQGHWLLQLGAGANKQIKSVILSVQSAIMEIVTLLSFKGITDLQSAGINIETCGIEVSQ